ncbi:MAG: response regulator transcription factor [Anaerolineaceae bacterium]
MEVITISIQPIIHSGLLTVFAECKDINIVGKFLDQESLIQKASDFRPDIILYDLQKFDVTIIETIKKFLGSFPKVKIVVLTNDTSSVTAKIILSLGISGYVSKEDDPACIIDAIRIVALGGLWISESVRRNLKVDKIESPSGNGSNLTRREIDVLNLLSIGLSDKEISRKLCISVRTAQYYVKQIRQKLLVTNRTEAVIKAIEMGIINVTDLHVN